MPDGSHEKPTPPRALTTPQILEVVQHYRKAALNAMRAGNNPIFFNTRLIYYDTIFFNYRRKI